MNQTNYLTDEQMAHFKGYYIIVFLIFIDLLGHYFLYNFLIEEMNQKEVPEVAWGKVVDYTNQSFLQFELEQAKNSETNDTVVIQNGWQPLKIYHQ